MTHFYGANPPVEQFDAYSTKTTSFINKFWPSLMRHNIDVILDFGFWKRRDRDLIREIAGKHRAEAILYNIVCDETVALKRCLERNRNLNGSFEICENTYQVLKDKIEPLGEDESYNLINTSVI